VLHVLARSEAILCCVRLNKCRLRSVKHNRMVSIKTEILFTLLTCA